MLRSAIENALIPVKAVWAGRRFHDPRSPKCQEPGPMAGKETHYVRCNSQALAMEGEVLA
jgi:hypothetical protein